MTSTLSERLNLALDLTGISQSELARRIGIKQQSISQICSGKTARSRYTSQIAEALDINGKWLATGEGSMGLGGNVDAGPRIEGKIPLINWVQAVAKTKKSERFANEEVEDWVPLTGSTHMDCFALTVRDDSMENPGGRLSVPEGARIVVDPHAHPKHKSLVVVRLAHANEATFKQLIIDGEQQYLKPLNPQYPAIPIDENCTIIGVVRRAIIDFE